MLEELRSLSEAKKKQVIIIATIIIMVIVIGVWASYFNSIVIGAGQQDTTAQATSSAATAPVTPAPTDTPPVIAPAPATPMQASGPGLWQDIKNMFGSIANIFRSPSQYDIKPQSN